MRVEIRRASIQDRRNILRVMEPANMHHVPSAEMDELDLDCFFVACVEGKIVGAAGYKMMSDGNGKTTLLAVLPEYRGLHIGKKLQDIRLRAMHSLGARKVTTNADRPNTISWYKHWYGYYEVGSIEKIHSFGDPDLKRWTTLEMDLCAWMENET
jgi:3-oxoadipate:acetyl-CoA acetyltransferase